MIIQSLDQNFAQNCGSYELSMSIDDEASEDWFLLNEYSIEITLSGIPLESPFTVFIDARSDYWEENYITATFEFLECLLYYQRLD